MQNEKLKIDIDSRTYRFALEIIKLVRKLPKETVGFELGRQLVRSATSIAANIEEAQSAFSKDDFIYKMNIALKEARETSLWLRLIKDAKLKHDFRNIEGLIKETIEIRNIIGAIVKSSKRKNK